MQAFKSGMKATEIITSNIEFLTEEIEHLSDKLDSLRKESLYNAIDYDRIKLMDSIQQDIINLSLQKSELYSNYLEWDQIEHYGRGLDNEEE